MKRNIYRSPNGALGAVFPIEKGPVGPSVKRLLWEVNNLQS